MPRHRASELEGFFEPESIAVIGVSRENVTFGGSSFLKRYLDSGIHMVIIDRLIPRMAFHSPEIPDSVSEIVHYIKTHTQTKPTVFTIDYDGGDDDLIRNGSQLRSRFCEAGIPAFPSLERAIGALARFQKYCGRFR